MAQPVQQVAIRAPGFQGLNTELSPINGDPEFALVADNVVVDQIGRLISRKAFADFRLLTDKPATDNKKEVSESVGFYPKGQRAWDFVGNEIQITTPISGDCYIQPLEVHVVDPDADIDKMFFKMSISLRDFSTSEIPPFSNPPAEFPDKLGRIFFYQLYPNRSQIWPMFPTDLFVDSVLDEGPTSHQWSYTSTIGTVIHEFEIDPSRALYVAWECEPGFAATNCPLQIRVSLEEVSYTTVADEKGRNEFITLGKDVIGRASAEQEQADFRPVFIYRYGDRYVYPKDPRTVPVGMKRQLAAPRRVPELEGNIQYGVGTYTGSNDKVESLGLPSGYDNEVLLTGEFVNFNANDITTGNDRLLLFVKGKPFLRLENDSDFVVAGGEWTDLSGNTYPIDGDIAVSAYGRVWVTGVGGDYHQIHYSSLLDETSWYLEEVPDPSKPKETFNDAGIIDVREYWPVDGDSIVNIHAHNGYLLVFGRNSILVYANADSGSPAGIINQPNTGIFLQDAISNVGLVRRDAICNIGTDVLFVDDTGVRSLGRVIQEKSNPLQEPSLNIRREIQDVIKTEILESPSHSAIRFRYMPSESLAVLLFASLKIAYAFHLNMPSKTGGLKVTRWTDCYWNDSIELKQAQEDVVFLAGKPAKGLMKYDGYLERNPDGDIEPYVMRYESMALALNQSPMQTTIPKSLHYVCMGEFVPGQANALWGFSDRFIGSREFQIEVDGGSEFNVNEFTDDGSEEKAGYYPDGGPYYKGYKINTTGSGELFRVGFEVKVQGGRYALQEIDINSAVGRLTA